MSCNHLHKIGGICCQKIIPLVFDQSYSYYEQLCAFLHKLNELVDAVNLQNTTIAEFENEIDTLFNEFKNEMRLAFADFQIEMRQEFEDFTTQIETEWSAYKTELNAEWENEQAINAAFRSDIQSAWNTYQTELNASFEIFKSQETAARQTFETNITNQQDTFETTITQQQENFENTIEQIVTDNADIVYMPFNGVQTLNQTDPPTMATIGVFPLDMNQTVQVYYKSANDSDYRFIKRRHYTADIENDADLPAWSNYNDKFILIFENPIINEYVKADCIPYATIGYNFGTQNRRLVIYKIPEIVNRHIDFSNAVLQGSYIQTGDVQFPSPMTIVEQPMTATANTYYTMFVIEQGCSKFIPQITQPTGATTRVYSGYLYSTFCGGVVRDPKTSENESKLANITFELGNEILANTNLNTVTTPGVYYAPSAARVGTITNKPIEDTTPFRLEVKYINANSKLIQYYYGNNGEMYFRVSLSANVWDSWYRIISGLNFRDNVNAVAFGGGNELSANTDLHDLTPGRYFVGQTNAPTIANRPESLTFGFNVECSSIFDRSNNRLKLRLYYNSPSTIGTFYECYLTSSGWSSWYKFSGTVVT